MKRKFLLPALVVVLGIGSAFASHRLTPAFYPGNDSDCSEQPIAQPCTIGNNTVCTDDDNQSHYYVPDIEAEEPVCLQLKRP